MKPLINYRALNVSDDAEIATVAGLHEQAPRYWIPGHSPTPEQIQRRIEQLTTMDGCLDRFFQLAEADHHAIVGFHWIDLEKENGETVGHIKSLWVHDGFHHQGIAAQLKRNGEVWAKSKGANFLRTTVHTNNPRMIDFNRRSGFVPGFIEMTKKL